MVNWAYDPPLHLQPVYKRSFIGNANSYKETENLMNQTTKKINNQNSEETSSESSKTKKNLEMISEEIDRIKDSFIKESMDKLNNDFLMIINNILTISNQQENLILESNGIRSNSPKIRKINEQQNNINRELFYAMEKISRTGIGPSKQYNSFGCSIKWKNDE